MTDGSELARHVLTDLLIKGAIVLAAVLAFVLGAVLLWRKLGR
ncbi:hypothetical protein [Amycolatopsis acididurans]|nr:hypothetical protein [Amycolatopsis acididurans]